MAKPGFFGIKVTETANVDRLYPTNLTDIIHFYNRVGLDQFWIYLTPRLNTPRSNSNGNGKISELFFWQNVLGQSYSE